MRRNWSRCAQFATPRLSEITAAADSIDDEDLIEREDMVVTVTMDGYIKRTPLSTFRAQARGGKGRAGMATKDEDGGDDVRHHHPQSGAVLQHGGQGLSPQGLRLPEGGPPRAVAPSSTCCPRSTRMRRSQPCCRCPRMRPIGARSRCLRHGQGQCAPQQHGCFANIPSNGKFAMRFEEGEDRLIGVALLGQRRCAAGEPSGQGDPLCRR
jgi:DNA gyrase subunit A